jgi:hypothetical protein
MSTTLALAPTSADRIHEIDTPLISATQVVARLGANPTITIPMVCGMVSGVEPDVDAIWRYLKEPADFFDLPIPERAALRAALGRFGGEIRGGGRALIAATVTLLDIDGRPDFVVTGTVVRPVRPTPVRIASCEVGLPVVRRSDPHWLRMAARTTSRGPVDQVQRWLDDGGFADAVPAKPRVGAPLLGALVFECADGLVGIDAGEPTSILGQLERCGAVSGVRSVDERPQRADRAWWISPNYETHPVVSIDDGRFDVDAGAAAPFVGLR